MVPILYYLVLAVIMFFIGILGVLHPPQCHRGVHVP